MVVISVLICVSIATGTQTKLVVRATRVELQEIPQLIIICEIWLQPTSRRFLRELDKAPGGNNLHYILQHLHVLASVTRVCKGTLSEAPVTLQYNREGILSQIHG